MSKKLGLNAPSYGPHMTNWAPGEKRSYIPVVSFGVQPNTPVNGVVGGTREMQGATRVTFVTRGAKTESTTTRKP